MPRDNTGYGVAVVRTHELLGPQILDSFVAEFILSYAEGFLRNDIGLFRESFLVEKN